jgi:hypothetical protein
MLDLKLCNYTGCIVCTYIQGPLYFGAIDFRKGHYHPGILRRFLESDIDVTARDEVQQKFQFMQQQS